MTGSRPERFTTDKHVPCPNTIRWIIGRTAWHRTTRYVNNYTGQSHRPLERRYYPMCAGSEAVARGSLLTALERSRGGLGIVGPPEVL